MTFAEWPYLAGLLAGPLVLLIGWRSLRRKQRRLESFAATLVSSNKRFLLFLVLDAAALTLAFAALAGPESDESGSTLQRRPADVVVAVDASRSMLACDVVPSRIERAKREILDLIDRDSVEAALPIRRIGLVEFAGSARLACPLTRDIEAVRSVVPGLNGRSLSRGGTSLGVGLDAALDALGRAKECPRAVVIVTDGEERGEHRVWGRALQRASMQGVPVFCLAVGTTDGARIPDPGGEGFVRSENGDEVLTRASIEKMQQAAAVTNGFWKATWIDPFPMEQIARKGIAPLGTTSDLEGGGFVEGGRGRALFQWFLLAAVILLLLKFFLPRDRDAVCRTLPLTAWIVTALCLVPVQGCGQGEGKSAARAGNGFYRQGRYDRAVAAFERSLDRSPGNSDVLLNMGLALYRSGEWDRALDALGEAERTAVEGRIGKRDRVQAARFARGLVLYAMAENAWLDEGTERTGLVEAADRAGRAGKRFQSCGRDGFLRGAAAINAACAATLQEKIRTRLEGAPARGADDDLAGDTSDGESVGGERGHDGEGRESGSGSGDPRPGVTAFRRGPGGRAVWDDPGPLTAGEAEAIFRRLVELKQARDEREAERARERRSEDSDW